MSKTGRHQRKLSNVKLTEKYRFMYLGHWIAICFLFLGLLDIAVVLLYDQLWQSHVPQGADLALEQGFRHTQLITTLVGFSSLFAAGILLLAAFTAHRIGGPYLALKRTMASIRDGDINSRLLLRNYDKLDDVEKAFNEMMDALQARYEGSDRSKGSLEVLSGSDSDSERGTANA